MWEPNRVHGQPSRTDRPAGPATPPPATQQGQQRWQRQPDTHESVGDVRADIEAVGELGEFGALTDATDAEMLPSAEAYQDETVDEDEESAAEDMASGEPGGFFASEALSQRAQARQLIREFLRAIPRDEADAVLMLTRPDGTTRLLTRAHLSAAIDRLRPRQRQIVRLTLEERWPRARVCAYLKNISLKTLERDQVEALDILAEL